MPNPTRQPLLPLEETSGLSLREAAHTYADAGLAVFPCWPGTKRPAVSGSFYDATDDHQQINRWWSWQPEANIALPTGHGIEVLDIDVHASGTGFEELRRVFDTGLGRQWAHAVRTPSGGLHLYYPSDPDNPQSSWSREKAHMDFRGTGGYIITVPSQIHLAGQPHRYQPIGPAYRGAPIEGEQVRELLTPLRPEAPDWWVPDGDLTEHAQRINGWLARYEGSNRSEALFWSACRLVEAGANETDSYAFLAETATNLGMREREILATIRRAHLHASPLSDQPTPVSRSRPAGWSLS
ncbi:bifunctional DNA primase/polymerase [Nesterenkonia alkaliphila]|uniref:DNA primase n=1 Tax=Nesterenkonia alkaliphila TaxID=1463631 RepID=A0A7K1UF76_9MICC|nr:bifunctional DNA primase/polymerase [Nesterenkonia alkaliphila]MVT25082.1 DNA primase [Nesterenkonia alkaliphila]GFZ83145.1 hypothetical protein GCM10011359_09790 [Nesterenkonia alkaliphila]